MTANASSPWLGVLLWVFAFVLMASSVVYQHLTGPTHPVRGAVTVDGQAHRYRLLRSEETVRDAVIVVPSPGGAVAGVLQWRRYPTDEPFVAAPMEPGTDGAGEAVVQAALPAQPSAGKVEYHIELTTPAGPVRIPADGEEEIVLRFKDPVPGYFLWPHVAVMFLSIMVGMRAGMSALWQPSTLRRYAWTTLIGLFVGGLILGPIVQKYAFGAFWTGFPWGYDLTDNKQLVMWLVWLVACVVLALRSKERAGVGRLAVLGASVVMVVVYLIPHSMRGSELDYDRLDRVEDPKEAIGTGR